MDLPETDFESGENSLRSNSIPRTLIRYMKEMGVPEEAVFLIEFM
jgi:vancomycin permeability regulator SanA